MLEKDLGTVVNQLGSARSPATKAVTSSNITSVTLFPAPSQKITPLAVTTLCIALFAVSFAPIFIRFSEMELGANATVFNRLLVFFVCFGTGRLLTQRFASPMEPVETTPPTFQQNVLLVGMGLISVISLVLWAVSLEHTSVAKCMLLSNLTPVFTSLGSWLWFGKRFDERFLMGLVIALGGAIFLGLEDLAGANGFLVGDLYAIASAIFLGTYFLMVERLRNWFSATTILLWRCAIGALFLLPILWFQGAQVFPLTLTAGLAVIGLGLVSEGLGQRLLAESMDKFSSSFLSLFLLLEPIVSALLAWAIFMEGLSVVTWVGFGVILTGIYLAQSSDAAIHG